MFETQYISSNAPFSQGDIIRLLNRQSPPHFGVVINADCDLLHQKTDGVCSYLPIYSFQEYLSEFWINKFLELQKNQLLSKILQSTNQPETEGITLKEWIESADHVSIPDLLAEEFELSASIRSRISKAVQQYVSIFSSDIESNEQFVRLCRIQNDPIGYARKQLMSAYKQMGQGHLFINEIYGQNDLGYVVRTKRIYSIQTDMYFPSEYEMYKNRDVSAGCAIRVAKLTNIMRFKLIQLFVHHFTRVGLPDEIEMIRDLIVEDTATTLLGDSK